MSGTLDDKKAELERAIQELGQWEEYDSRREDGSGAQDRRHEERGESLRKRVAGLSAEVDSLSK
ncbi:hypothetical protein [Pseudomonas syringae]|uniref:hypothetical protein n=1 Tax=Pseudomonas syringae TaxID=317 RepID=UPI00051720DD|nr:hypothetical protein [Pseudomonas syringae]